MLAFAKQDEYSLPIPLSDHERLKNIAKDLEDIVQQVLNKQNPGSSFFNDIYITIFKANDQILRYDLLQYFPSNLNFGKDLKSALENAETEFAILRYSKTIDRVSRNLAIDRGMKSLRAAKIELQKLKDFLTLNYAK